MDARSSGFMVPTLSPSDAPVTIKTSKAKIDERRLKPLIPSAGGKLPEWEAELRGLAVSFPLCLSLFSLPHCLCPIMRA